jgi:hypothetical protein
MSNLERSEPTQEAEQLSLSELEAVSAGGARLVAVKTISWSHDDEAPKETVTF